MFRTTQLFSLLISILLLASIGCVRSTQPILNDEQVVTDNSVVGKWISEDGKNKLDIQAADDNKEYKVLYTDEKDKPGNFIVRLGRMDGMLIAEIRPEAPVLAANDSYKSLVLPLYSFLVVNQTTPQLVVSSLSIDWLKKYVQTNPGELETTRVGNDDFIVSATTADFQAFFLKHHKDEGAMGDKTTFVRP